MQVRTPVWALLACAMLLAAGPAAANHGDIKYDETGNEIDTHAAEKDDNVGTVSPFSAVINFFSDDKGLEAFEGKFIDKVGKVPPAPPSKWGEPGARGSLTMRANGVAVASIPVLDAYINKVLQGIVAAGPDPGIRVRAYVISKGAFEAFSTPDGGIFLSHGLIRDLRTKEELAAVLAHELSHILLRHHGDDWFVKAQNKATAVAEIVLAIREYVRTKKGKGKMSVADKIKFRLISKSANFFSEDIIWPSLSREVEDAADLYGVDLMSRANYTPEGMSSFFELQIEADKQRSEGKLLTKENYDGMLAQKMKEEGTSGLIAGLTDIAFDQFANLSAEIKSSFGEDHRPTEERADIISDYLDREYEELTGAEQNSSEWTAILAEPSVAAVFELYQSAETAESVSKAKDGAGNGTELAQQISANAGQHAYPYLKLAGVYLSNQNAVLAQRYFVRAVKASGPPLRAYTELLGLYRDHRYWKPMAAVLDRAMREFKDNPSLLPDRILAFNKRGQGENAQSLLLKCKLEGNERLFERCKKYSKGKFEDVQAYKVNLPRSAATSDPFEQLQPLLPMVMSKPSKLNVRSGPGKNDPVVFSLASNSRLTVIGRSGKRLNVRDAQDRTGWVADWLTVPVSSTASSEQPKFVEKTVFRPVRSVIPPKPNRSATGSDRSPEARLSKLKKLFKRGLITDEEYKKKRSEILESL